MELDARKLTGDLAFDGGRGAQLDADRKGDWMQTYSGRRLYPADPRPSDVDMISMVQSISNKPRYNGHCLPYMVAEHSVLISRLVKPSERSRQRFGDDAPRVVAKYGLVHDAVEEVISDIIRPVKRVLGKSNDIFKLEDDLWVNAFAPFFGLDPELPQEVIDLDTAICVLERRVLHARADDWHLPFEEPKAVIQGLNFMEAGRAFYRRYCELWDKDYETEAR